MTFAEALRYLAEFVDLERGGMSAASMGLDRITALLEALDWPERRYRSVLIAGTKGKGSTAAMLERALRAAGYRTGLYTQPHLHTIRERIRINGENVSAKEFAEGMSAAQRAVELVCAACGPTTAYEVVTALALDTFARAAVDVAVLEVGLGGRLDATNAVAADVSVLTSISLDHTAILGNTVEAIAREKADIIKPGHPVVSAPQPPGALAVLREVAQQRGASLRVVGESSPSWAGTTLVTGSRHLPDVQLALAGEHQRINAAVVATVVEALSELGIPVPLGALRAGLEDVQWPGRFEVVPGSPEIVLDGAHNVESAQRLAETLANRYPGTRPVYVLGIAADKDVLGILQALVPSEVVIATQSQQPRALPAAQLATLAAAAGHPTVTVPSVGAALTQARARANVVVVTGSLYVVAEAREALGLAAPSGEDAFNPWGMR